MSWHCTLFVQVSAPVAIPSAALPKHYRDFVQSNEKCFNISLVSSLVFDVLFYYVLENLTLAVVSMFV